MRPLTVLIFCLVALNAFGQNNELSPEEQARFDQILADYSHLQVAKVHRGLGQLISDYPHLNHALPVARFAKNLVDIGKPAPSLDSVQWIQGAPAPAKLSVLVFWTPDCPHCLEDLPHSQELSCQFNDQDVQFIGLTPNDTTEIKAKIADSLRSSATSFPAGVVPEEWKTRWDLSRLPLALLVRDGRIVWRGHPLWISAETLEAALDY
ncbi:MAG: redoxin domain-containing protein [Acidobacteria bacterium]|nr:redoxin domain-containing protein [Acidobacteriota bacterium]MCB9398377.1 redoxin domain-containing protein [Acidobacteriota bacterium]